MNYLFHNLSAFAFVFLDFVHVPLLAVFIVPTPLHLSLRLAFSSPLGMKLFGITLKDTSF